MARWLNLEETRQALGKTVNLNRSQWLVLALVLSIPILAVFSNVFGLGLEARANQDQISNSQQLVDELNAQNQLMSQTIEDQQTVIAKQKRDINALRSDNQVLSNTLTATEAELAEEDKKEEEHKKKKFCWWCDND